MSIKYIMPDLTSLANMITERANQELKTAMEAATQKEARFYEGMARGYKLAAEMILSTTIEPGATPTMKIE
jgi:hypothetical protein